MNKLERAQPAIKVKPVDPEIRARDLAATNAAYAANKDRTDRVFGTAFSDVWWQRPSARRIKRISTGDIFQSYDYNGGYPSFFMLRHGEQRLKGEYRTLYVNAHSYEPIVLIGPALVYRQPPRPWTAEELNLIASFFQTRTVEMRNDTVASMRENGHADMASALERSPMPRVSIVPDTEGLISNRVR